MKHAAALRTIREALIRADAHEALDALDSIERESLQAAPQQAAKDTPHRAACVMLSELGVFSVARVKKLEAMLRERDAAPPESPTLKTYTWTVRKTEARYFSNEALITIGGIEGELTLVVRPNWDVSPDTGNLRYTETLEQAIARYVGKTYGVTIEESSA